MAAMECHHAAITSVARMNGNTKRWKLGKSFPLALEVSVIIGVVSAYEV